MGAKKNIVGSTSNDGAAGGETTQSAYAPQSLSQKTQKQNDVVLAQTYNNFDTNPLFTESNPNSAKNKDIYLNHLKSKGFDVSSIVNAEDVKKQRRDNPNNINPDDVVATYTDKALRYAHDYLTNAGEGILKGVEKTNQGIAEGLGSLGEQTGTVGKKGEELAHSASTTALGAVETGLSTAMVVSPEMAGFVAGTDLIKESAKESLSPEHAESVNKVVDFPMQMVSVLAPKIFGEAKEGSTKANLYKLGDLVAMALTAKAVHSAPETIKNVVETPKNISDLKQISKDAVEGKVAPEVINHLADETQNVSIDDIKAVAEQDGSPEAKVILNKINTAQEEHTANIESQISPEQKELHKKMDELNSAKTDEVSAPIFETAKVETAKKIEEQQAVDGNKIVSEGIVKVADDNLSQAEIKLQESLKANEGNETAINVINEGLARIKAKREEAKQLIPKPNEPEAAQNIESPVTEEKPVEEVKVVPETDYAERQKLQNHLTEGEEIVKIGSWQGRKFSKEEIEAVKKQNEKVRKKLGIDNKEAVQAEKVGSGVGGDVVGKVYKDNFNRTFQVKSENTGILTLEDVETGKILRKKKSEVLSDFKEVVEQVDTPKVITEHLPKGGELKGVTEIEVSENGEEVSYGTKTRKTSITVKGLSVEDIKQEIKFEKQVLERSKRDAANFNEDEIRSAKGLTRQEKEDAIKMHKQSLLNNEQVEKIVIPFYEKHLEIVEQSLKETPKAGSVGVGGDVKEKASGLQHTKSQLEEIAKEEGIDNAIASFKKDLGVKENRLAELTKYEKGKLPSQKTKSKEIQSLEKRIDEVKKDVENLEKIKSEQSLKETPKAETPKVPEGKPEVGKVEGGDIVADKSMVDIWERGFNKDVLSGQDKKTLIDKLKKDIAKAKSEKNIDLPMKLRILNLEELLLRVEKVPEAKPEVVGNDVSSSAPQGEKMASGFVSMPLSKIKKALKDFQGRSAEFSKKTYNSIVEGAKNGTLNISAIPPIQVWGKTGELLSGHSRVKAFEDLASGKHELNSKYKKSDFENIATQVVDAATREEAKKIAETSNSGATQTPLENSKILSKLRKDGATKTEIDNRATELAQHGEKKKTISLSHLDPNGKAFKILEQAEKNPEQFKTDEQKEQLELIKKGAEKAGDMRALFPELTTLHEDEIFDAIVNKDVETKDVASRINRAVNGLVEPFDPNNKLNLADIKNISPEELVYQQRTAELNSEIKELEKSIKKDKATKLTPIEQQVLEDAIRLNGGDKVKGRAEFEGEKAQELIKKKTDEANKLLTLRRKDLQDHIVSKKNLQGLPSLFDEINNAITTKVIDNGTANRFIENTTDVAKDEPIISSIESEGSNATTPEQAQAVLDKIEPILNGEEPEHIGGGAEPPTKEDNPEDIILASEEKVAEPELKDTPLSDKEIENSTIEAEEPISKKNISTFVEKHFDSLVAQLILNLKLKRKC